MPATRVVLQCLLLSIATSAMAQEEPSSPDPSEPLGQRRLSTRFEDRFHDVLAANKINKFPGNLRKELASLTLEEVPVALRLANEMPDSKVSNELHSIYSAIFRRWAKFVDPETLLPKTDEIPDQLTRLATQYALCTIWAEKDPTAALSHLLTLPPGDRRDNPINQILIFWTASDINQTADIVQKVGPERFPRAAIIRLTGKLARLNPDRALDIWLDGRKNRPPKESYDESLAPIFQRFGEMDPKRGIARADSLGQKDWKDMAYGSLATGWSSQDAPAAFDWLRQNNFFTPAIRDAFFREWARRDPLAAAKATSQLDEFQRLPSALIVAGTWFIADPAAAFAWVKSLPDSSMRQTFINSTIATLASTQPEIAARETLDLPSGTARKDLLVRVVARWAELNPPAVGKWVTQLPDTDEKSLATTALIQAWGNHDAPAAADWLLGLSVVELSKNAELLVNLWTRQDADRALQWATALPSEKGRDPASLGLCQSFPEARSAEAMPLAATIRDETMRLNAMSVVAARWFATDLNAATAWIVASPLSAEQKRQLLSTADSHR